MAKGTYIGFEKTTPITYVNWAEVGANFNKKVDAELKRRDDLLKEIDESTNAIIDKVNSQPRGNFQQGNDFMASVADQVTALTTLQYKAFNDGLVTQKEYATFRNNVKTSTNDLITLRDSMEDYFTKLQEGDVSGESRWEAEQIEGLAKFGTSMPILDDMTGQFNLAKKIVNKDGTISAGETLSAAELKFFMGRIYENYNLGEEAKKATDRLGEVTRADLRLTNKYGGLNRVITSKDKKAGVYNMLSDTEKTAVGGYIDWEDKTVESIMSNPHTKASIASEFLGMTFTYNEGDVDDKTIFKNRANEGNPEFTTDQDDEIAKVIRLQLRASIDVEEKVTKLDRTPFPPDYGRTTPTPDLERGATMLEYGWSGNAQQVAAFEEYVKNITGAQSVTRQEEGVEIIDMRGNREFLRFGTGTGDAFEPMTREDYFRSVGGRLVGENNVNKILDLVGTQQFGYTELTADMKAKYPDLYATANIGDRVLKPLSTEIGTGATIDVPLSEIQKVDFKKREVLANLDKQGDTLASLFEEKDQKAIPSLKAALSKYGIEVDYGDSPRMGEKARFRYGVGDDAEEITLKTNRSANEAKVQASAVIDFIKGVIPADKFEEIYSILLSSNQVTPVPAYAGDAKPTAYTTK